jgi:exodeoxyribonuclease V alpha subunit
MGNQQNENLIDGIVFEKSPVLLKEMVVLASQKLNVKNIDFFTLFDLCEIEPKIIPTILPGLFLTLFSELSDGSTCIDLNDQRIIELLKAIKYEKPEKMIEALLKEVNKDKLKSVISNQADKYLPLIIVMRENKNYLYLNKSWTAEFSLNGQLGKFFSKSVGIKLNVNQKLLDEIDTQSPILDNAKSPRKYNDEQKNAIELSLKKSFLVITGGPGTGKTFTLTGILRLLLRCGISITEIALAAPTAKAANRMNDSISENIKTIQAPSKDDLLLLELKSTTIHRLLGLTEYNRESKFSEAYPMPIKVLVIDESSMIDLFLMNTLLSSVDHRNTNIILIGDKDQLPSVDSGAVLADLISGNKSDGVAYLQKTYRSVGHMLEFVHGIKNKIKGQPIPIKTFKNIGQFFNDPESSVGLIDWQDLDIFQFKAEIKYWVHQKLKNICIDFSKIKNPDENAIKNYLKGINQTKILSVVNKGAFGVDGINQVCIDEILSLTKSDKEYNYFHGMPIQILRNNDKQELYNGDVGVIIKDEHDSFRAVFARANGLKDFTIDTIPSFQPAYATTIHKSQGSEYNHVLLVIPKDATEMLVTKQLLYTGISRAKTKCLIIATIHDFQKGLDNEIHRITGVRLA